PKEIKLTITNSGEEDLILKNYTFSGSNATEFTVRASETEETIQAGKTYEFSVIFKPTEEGSKTAILTIISNIGEHKVNISGKGTPEPVAVFNINPESKDFGDVEVDATASQTFKITNTGNADLIISTTSLSNTSDFSTDLTNKTITPSGFYEFSVAFKPTTEGIKTTTIKLTTNIGEYTVSLKGNATPKTIIIVSPGFVTNWKTTTSNETITIPTNSSYTYNYTVEWGDGTVSENHTGDASHTYDNPGVYNVAITGTFPAIFFNNTGDKTKIKGIKQWGNIAWKSMEGAFHGCTYLNSTATDIPDLSQVTSMASMFNTAYRYQFDEPIGDWDVSNVTDMSNLFKITYFNKNISNWNVSNVTNMLGMFEGARDFNQDISSWNVSSVTNMSLMFLSANSFNQNLDSWDVSNVTDMSWMFYKNEAFNGSINNWDVSSVTTMRSMFEKTLVFDQPLGNWNISSLSNVFYMFTNAVAFNQDISKWNINNGKLSQLPGMFKGAIAFNQDLSAWDMSNITSMSGMFEGASSFNQNLGDWDITKVEFQLGSMLDDTALSVANYNATLLGWSQQAIVYENILGAKGLKFCNDGESARNALIAKGWTFNGDSKSTDSSCQ
ncbi:BspA family leucine-rich repeat surface protein, partial [Tenacibaculum caenipelagi]|uniref:BspA family leucine-rich repeat surface protein n=1 Tax=Tenacibaculum caenipelagi TaxID=1325435 RepID=UPI001414D6EB